MVISRYKEQKRCVLLLAMTIAVLFSSISHAWPVTSKICISATLKSTTVNLIENHDCCGNLINFEITAQNENNETTPVHNNDKCSLGGKYCCVGIIFNVGLAWENINESLFFNNYLVGYLTDASLLVPSSVCLLVDQRTPLLSE